MKINFAKKIGFVLTMTLMLAGCQAATNVQPAAPTQEVQPVPNTPFTKGPTSPPSVKGPTMALPDSDGVVSTQEPQAMTETVNSKFTLNSK